MKKIHFPITLLPSYPLHIKTLSLLFLFLIPLCSFASVINVPGDYLTIQAAIDAAVHGDEIIVSPGTYYENINFGGKNIILRSTDPTSPTVVANTVIDGHDSGSVVTFSGSELTPCVLSGFTITDGYGQWGGGINGNGTLATIEYNNITTNGTYIEEGGMGGGLYNCDGTIQNNTIEGNRANCGGGLYSCDGTIQNNTIEGNTAVIGAYIEYGGGLCGCHGAILNNIISGNRGIGGGLFQCNGTIRNNSISGNWYGGIYECDGTIQNNSISYNYGSGLFGCGGTIRNNTISGNSGSGLYYCGGTIQNNTITGNSGSYGGGLDGCRGFIINCIIWGNSASVDSQLYKCSSPFYSCIQDWTGGGRGNITSDPEFVDPANGDYHLQPGSPCIDAGNTFYLFGDYLADVDGECRVAGSLVDMGADEYNSSVDRDGDLLSDADEASQGSDPDISDSDGDGLMDGVEVMRGTNPDVFNTPPGISIPADYPTVQEAIFKAFPLEAVTIAQGTYYEKLHFLAKNIILQSTDPADEDIVDTTIIDGGTSFSVIMFSGAENENCILKGFTICHGSAWSGGGIYGRGTLATIENNKITTNSAYDEGGGLSGCDGNIRNNTISYNSAKYDGGLSWCAGTIQNNIISNNTAFYCGGGLSGCDGTIQNNTISNNSVEYDGGGLYRCDATIQNNIISNNTGKYGGGLYYCDGTIQNNTIWGNSAGYYGGGLYICEGTIRNCIIWQNTAPLDAQLYDCVTPSYSCIQDWTGGDTGNISDAPQLVDPANGDFHLLSDSPCVDAGGAVTLSQDFEGDPRPYDAVTWEPRGDGSDYDIGADEFIGVVPTPTPTPTPTVTPTATPSPTPTPTPTGCVPIPVDTWTFEPPPEGWSYRTAAALLGIPSWDHAMSVTLLDALGLTAPANEMTDYYGSWDNYTGDPGTPAIAWAPNSVWRAIFTMSTDKAEPNTVPSIRLRLVENHMKASSYIRLYPGDWLPLEQRGSGTTDYTLYFRPPVEDNGFFLAFDLVDFRPAPFGVACDGTVYLEEVAVDRFDLGDPCFDSLWTEVKSYSGTELHSWGHSSAGVPYLTDINGHSWPTEGLEQNTTLAQTRAFGAWASPIDEIALVPDQFYRAVWTLACEDSTVVATIRMRMHTSDYRYASYMTINRDPSDPANSPLPPITGRDYYLYAEFPAVPTVDKLILAWDLYDFDPLAGGWAKLTEVSVSRRELP